MSPDEIDPGHEWPLPPPWMWDCDECADLYRTMRNVGDRIAELRLTGERGVDWDPFDSTVTTQIALGAHLAARHRDLLPDWDPACATCARHRSGSPPSGNPARAGTTTSAAAANTSPATSTPRPGPSDCSEPPDPLNDEGEEIALLALLNL